MTDLATLGLRVDSRQLVQGAQALDRLGDQATASLMACSAAGSGNDRRAGVGD